MNKASHDALQNLIGNAHAANVRSITELLKEEKHSPIATLSARELQVFIAIGSGLQPVQAATRLGIAVKSFSTYRTRLLDKLKLSSNAELAILAFELKLVPSVLMRLKEER